MPTSGHGSGPATSDQSHRRHVRELIAEASQALGCEFPDHDAVTIIGSSRTLPSRLPVSALAQATVAVVGLAASELGAVRTGTGPRRREPLTIDSGAVAAAFTSERHLRLDGRPQGGMDPLSAFLPAADGWVRLHGNYPHHRARLRAALGIADTTADPTAAVTAAVATLTAAEVEDRVVAHGGVAAAVRDPAGWERHPQGRALAGLPLMRMQRWGDEQASHGSRRPPGETGLPAAGIRVLDLTRVIAGPVGTRTLAFLGADVLRVDSPRLPEIPAQHLDTGPGKRSTFLDLGHPTDRRMFEELVASADVVVTGYRPGALDRFGLSPQALHERHPGIVVATLNAWGPTGPWARRRGFDSLVQAATGIATTEAGGDPGSIRPGVLPAQALDHATGYLTAAAVLRALTLRHRESGSWHAQLSLAQTATWLLARAKAGEDAGGSTAAAGTTDTSTKASTDTLTGPADVRPVDATPWLDTIDSDAGRLTYVLPPLRLDGGPRTWSHPPRSLGASSSTWL
ncbi:CoA transferase [Protofrankia symbiont of Coriaria ruscifolia]|uniref:CoA transferase n=1 Tax=Protofrankia symbiont of Coriaria ruscifolia TaxID=1306542 RepID=UPI001040E339|nr:CoA transferase [Protofrankia symbiont of Coriaria ruscifolia]